MGLHCRDWKGEGMSNSTEKSKALFERALQTLIEGGSSPSRGPANYGDYPLFSDRGEAPISMMWMAIAMWIG